MKRHRSGCHGTEPGGDGQHLVQGVVSAAVTSVFSDAVSITLHERSLKPCGLPAYCLGQCPVPREPTDTCSRTGLRRSLSTVVTSGYARMCSIALARLGIG